MTPPPEKHTQSPSQSTRILQLTNFPFPILNRAPPRDISSLTREFETHFRRLANAPQIQIRLREKKNRTTTETENRNRTSVMMLGRISDQPLRRSPAGSRDRSFGGGGPLARRGETGGGDTTRHRPRSRGFWGPEQINRAVACFPSYGRNGNVEPSRGHAVKRRAEDQRWAKTVSLR